jgi:hypothetical protein
LSLYRAQQSLAANLKGIIMVDGTATQDTNPPLYILLLQAWRGMMGETVFALRYLGVVAGVLSVPLFYQLGRCLYGRSAALLAAFLLTISPFHIWQSQEMRNYPLLLLLNLLSVYALFQLVRRLETRGSKTKPIATLLLWLCASLLGVATHYFGFFVFAFGVMALLLTQWRRVWRWLLLAGILALPLVWLAYGRFSAGQQFDFQQIPIGDLLQHAASVYSVGIIPGIIQPWWRIFPVLTAVILGVIWGWRQHRRATGFTIGYLVIPLAILFLLSFINPLYNGPRHLLIGLPPFLLLAAAAWRSRLGKFLLIVAIISQLQWVWVQFNAPELMKDDVRGLADYLNEVVRPGDAVILHDTLIGFTFDYYYEGDWTAVPRLGQNRQQVQNELTALTANRLWFVTYPTPRTGFPVDFVPEVINSHFTHLLGRRFPSLWLGVKLDAYVPHPIVPTLPATVPAYDVQWQNGLQLRGVQAETAVGSGHEWWPDLYWAGASNNDVIAQPY